MSKNLENFTNEHAKAEQERREKEIAKYNEFVEANPFEMLICYIAHNYLWVWKLNKDNHDLPNSDSPQPQYERYVKTYPVKSRSGQSFQHYQEISEWISEQITSKRARVVIATEKMKRNKDHIAMLKNAAMIQTAVQTGVFNKFGKSSVSDDTVRCVIYDEIEGHSKDWDGQHPYWNALEFAQSQAESWKKELTEDTPDE